MRFYINSSSLSAGEKYPCLIKPLRIMLPFSTEIPFILISSRSTPILPESLTPSRMAIFLTAISSLKRSYPLLIERARQDDSPAPNLLQSISNKDFSLYSIKVNTSNQSRLVLIKISSFTPLSNSAKTYSVVAPSPLL